MPRSTLTPEQQVVELNKRASEANQRIILKKVTLALKMRPDLAVPCWEKLMSLGIPEQDLLDPAKSTAAAETTSRQLQAMKAKKRERDPVSGPPPLDSSPARTVAPSDPWPASRLQVQLLTPTVLKKQILCELAPGNWSLPNLSKANLPKERLLELFEYATGLGPDFELRGDYRSIATTIMYFKAEHSKRKDRANALVLPVSWARSGLYKVEGITQEPADGLIIDAAFLGRKILLPMDLVPQHDCVADFAVTHNYSELRATLVSRKDPQRSQSVLLMPEFQKVIGSIETQDGTPDQAQKRQRTPLASTRPRSMSFEGEPSPPVLQPRALFGDPEHAEVSAGSASAAGSEHVESEQHNGILADLVAAAE
eukprot:6490854-Amphidinium_carterae.1